MKEPSGCFRARWQRKLQRTSSGTKELLAVVDGYRESTESWQSVLRDLKRRGMRAPVLAIGDGALGFWSAIRDVWPETEEQLDWCHKMANVLDKLPKRLQPKARLALREILYAATTNPIESAFATVRLRQRVTKGAGNRTKGLVMAFKLLAMAQQRWRKLNGAHLLPLVRAGVEFKNGSPVERNNRDQKEAA